MAASCRRHREDENAVTANATPRTGGERSAFLGAGEPERESDPGDLRHHEVLLSSGKHAR